MRLSQKILIPLILLSCITLGAVGFSSYTSMEREVETIYSEQMAAALETIRSEQELSNELTSFVLGEIDEKNLALSRALAEIVRVDPETMLQTDEMVRIANLLDVDEVHVSDENGILLYGNVPDFYGFDFASSEQSLPFMEILRNPSLQIAQEPQPRGTNNQMFQYTGVSRSDQSGIVQVGIDASVVSELSAMLNVQNKVAITKIGHSGFTAILENGVFTAHKNSSRVGEDISTESWYREVSSSGDALMWLTVDNTEYLVAHEQSGNQTILAFLPRSEYMAGLDNIRNTTIFLIIISAIVLVLVLFLCLRSFILKPIGLITDTMTKVAAGNLGVRIDKKYSGEIGQLTTSINRTVTIMSETVREISIVLTKLSKDNYDAYVEGAYEGDFQPIKVGLNRIITRINRVMSNVNVSATNVDASAQNIAHSSVTLSKGAGEQTHAVSDLSQTVEEISRHTSAAADASRKTNLLANDTAKNAERGNAEMKEMLSAMQEIQDVSNKIASVNDVISNIAMQTNLLALNASVEAARAGAQGKGFAVVAEQVGQLAAQSQSAAQDTSRLIENTMAKVAHGMQIADGTASSLEKIVSGVHQISAMMKSVAEEASAQEESIRRIHDRIDQISHVTQVNSVTSDEVATTASSLSQQSHGFKSLVDGFNLKQDENIAGYLE